MEDHSSSVSDPVTEGNGNGDDTTPPRIARMAPPSELEWPNYLVELQFGPGPLGLSLSPVIRCGTRAIGARVTGFTSSEDGTIGQAERMNEFSACELCVGDVLESMDGTCAKYTSFDRIMASLLANQQNTRRLRFRNVEAAWLHSLNRGSPDQSRRRELTDEIMPSGSVPAGAEGNGTGPQGSNDQTPHNRQWPTLVTTPGDEQVAARLISDAAAAAASAAVTAATAVAAMDDLDTASVSSLNSSLSASPGGMSVGGMFSPSGIIIPASNARLSPDNVGEASNGVDPEQQFDVISLNGGSVDLGASRHSTPNRESPASVSSVGSAANQSRERRSPSTNDSTHIAALESMVADLLNQKMAWVETQAQSEDQVRGLESTVQRQEQELEDMRQRLLLVPPPLRSLPPSLAFPVLPAQ